MRKIGKSWSSLMCFDTQSSLLAWSLTYSISLFLYFRNKNYDRWNAAFIMTLSTIQLLEAGIWYTPKYNEVLTMGILITLITQPLVQNYMGYKHTQKDVLGYASWIFLGLLIWTLFRIFSSGSGQFSTSVGPSGHLVWNDAKSSFLGGWWITALYLAGLFVPLFFMKEGKGGVLMTRGAITVVLSLLVTSSGEFSSYWCYTTVIYGLAALFI